MVKAEWRLTSALISSLAPLAASSEVMHEPLWVENLSPLAQAVALPSQRSADIKEGISVTLHADVATHFVSQVSDSERVFFLMGKRKRTMSMSDGVSHLDGN